MPNAIPNVKDIFSEALKLESLAERNAYLDDVCSSHSSIRAEVESLLAAHGAADGFLSRAADQLQPTIALNAGGERIGTQIGPYKLIEQIGQGGMGTVYLAEQKQPVRRTVALKLIKRGMDSEQVVARFEAERQALALMNHPHIARVLDAGVTDDGRPYFVMELVRGIPITEYCDQHRLDRRERLKLFIKVCQAVQHAHQKGVIHRDLKPSNVLVELHDVSHVPKVIDFGVAKATNQRLTERTLVTQFSQMIGTPLYMSPEQAEFSGLDVDTRSDIYSLGVLLYELITGSTPFEKETFKEVSLDEIRRIIREDEPQRPSQRISTLNARNGSTVAEHKRADVRRLSREIERELDWIVMKSLEKDRSRRYETATAFGADIQRYLDDEPVLACPPSLGYRFHKYARRHRAQLFVVATVASLLAIGTLVSSSLAAWAVQERSVARHNEVVANREKADALNAQALAEQQSRLAKQMESLANQQRDAAEYDAYVANIRLAYRNWDRGESLFKNLAAMTPKPGRPDFRSWEWYLLNSMVFSHQFLFPFQGNAIAWSPTRDQLATADQSGLVNLWNTDSGVLEKSFHGCPGQISSIAWSPNGKRLAASSDHHVAAIWDIESGKVVHSLKFASEVQSVDWNPDSVRLASAAKDGIVAVWDSITGRELVSLTLNAGPAIEVDWHPLGNLLLARGGSVGKHELVIWDTATATEVYRNRVGYSGDLVFSPDGKSIVLGNHEQSVLDWESQVAQPAFEIRGGYKRQWRPDGQQLAISTFGGSVKILDVGQKALTRLLPVHDNFVNSQLAWSSTSSHLAASASEKIKVWEADQKAANPLTLSTPGRHGLSIAFSPDGKRLLEGVQYGLLKMWDARTGVELFSRQSNDLTWNRAVAFSPDGKRFAALKGDQNGIVIHDADTGDELLRWESSSDEVRALDWSPNGETLAVGLRGRIFRDVAGRVGLFDTRSGDLFAVSSYTADEVNDVAWRMDGQQLAASGAGIRIWNAQLENERIIAGQSSCVDWSPDGEKLASGNWSGMITVYKTDDWTSSCVLDGNTAFVQTVAWHPHMPRIASGSKDGTVRLFDTSTGQELCVLDAHGALVQDVTWSPDGLQLATAGHDGVARIWDGSPADRRLKLHSDLRERAYDSAYQKEYISAIETLSQLRKLHPDEKDLRIQMERLRWLLAMDLALSDQVAEGHELFAQLEGEQADVPDYRLYLPGKLFTAGQHDAAITMAERLIAQFPDRQEYRDELGYLYESQAMQLFQEGQFAGALPVLRKLADEFSDRADPRCNLAYAAAKSGRLWEAVQLFAELAEAFDARPDYRPPLARRLSVAGEHELAARIYEQLIDDYPDADEYQTTLALERAQAMISGDELDEAIELLRGLDGTDLQQLASQLLGNAHLARARKQLEETNFTNAIDDLSSAFGLLNNAEKSRIGYELALAQLALGRVDDYRETCFKLLAHFGDSKVENEAHWLAWGCCLAPDAVSDFAVPIAAAEVALRFNPESVDHLTTLGAIQYRADQYDQALATLLQASELASAASTISPAYCWYFLAMTHQQLGRPADANEWLKKANEKTREELGTEDQPRQAGWNRRLTLQLLREEAEQLVLIESDFREASPAIRP